jgi:hypothetical protein
MLGSAFGGRFLTYLWPSASEWLIRIGLICTVIAVPWLIVCAFKSRPGSALILVATLLFIFAPNFAESENANWLMTLGFRIHASPIEQYLTTCRMSEFTENGVKQSIGDCERDFYEVGFPAALAYVHVIYDPSRNLLKPEAERTPEWQEALEGLLSAGSTVSITSVRHLFADFYMVDYY